MNINEATNQLVQVAIADLLENIRNQIAEKVLYEVSDAVSGMDIQSLLHSKIKDIVGQAVTTYHWPNDVPSSDYNEDAVVQGITNEFRSRTWEFLTALTGQVQQKIIDDAHGKLSSIDYRQIVREQTAAIIANSVQTYNFPPGSIPITSINTEYLTIPGTRITPGLIKKFESTGIQDSATRCQLTILDEATVFENKLISKDIEIAGSAVFNGAIDFRGTMDQSSPFMQKVIAASVNHIATQYTDGFYDQYCQRVLDKLDSQGVSASQVRVGDQALVENERLAGTITESNLQKVGALRELQVIGETLLDETVYVSNKRLGINTLEPERALDIWDQEVQVTVGKRQQNIAQINTPRNQQLVIGTGNRDQLWVNLDGSISVQQIDIGKLRHSSQAAAPTDNRPMGTIVWNERPQIGAPIGWVSLGGARWARFGTISE